MAFEISDSVTIALVFFLAIVMLCLTFLIYNASPDKLCFVQGNSTISGLLDMNESNPSLSPLIEELRINSVSGGVSLWIPCSRLGAS
jgi:hypothetical protein